MNFHYSTNTTHRPQGNYSNFNEDAHCDNEVNLILEKNYNQQYLEQVIYQEKASVVVKQTDQYYFMPIREQSSTMALLSNNNNNNSSNVNDLNKPSKENLFDFPSDSTTKSNKNFHLTDTDLAALFSPSIDNKDELSNNDNNSLDDVFLKQVNDFVCSSQDKSIGPPPGFENFRFDSSSLDNSITIPSINSASIQSQVSDSDTINFSQLLQSTSVDTQQQQLIGGNIRSSSSSHSSFTSDEQSIFFPMTNHHYSSQICQNNKSFSSITPNLITKKYVLNSLSSNKNQQFSSNNIKSPIETDRDLTPNSFFSQDNKNLTPIKSTTNRQSSSSTSSSTSSSIDEALIQLSQQQGKCQTKTINKLFSDESLSIFNFPSPTTKFDKQEEQQRAVNDNINFLASMTAAATLDSTWQQPAYLERKNSSTNIKELTELLNEICYRGFDELNALIQEQRWLQNYLNINSPTLPTPTSPLININSTNSCSSCVLIIPEYFIFKCKKVEITASHIYELLAIGRPELRLKDLMFVFKSWKESITNNELIQQEEDMKLRMAMEHPHSFYMNSTVMQAAFDRISNAIRQLANMTQQARAAFQYATLNVFQMSSRQQQSQTLTNGLQLTNSIAQFQTMQQQKSSKIHRIGNCLHTPP